VDAGAYGGVHHEKRTLTALHVARKREEGRGLPDSEAALNAALSLRRAGIAGEERVLVAVGLGSLLVVAEKVGGLALLVRRTVGSRESLPRARRRSRCTCWNTSPSG